MKLKNALKILIILIITCFNAVSFAQETNKAKDNADPAAVFEQALRNYEMKKQQEQDILITKLYYTLGQATDAWIDSAKKDKDSKLGTRLEQSWEKLSSTFKISAGHYDYYLRGYKYAVIKNDVVRSESLATAYKAVVVIKEDLFVEKNHSPDVSDNNPYFYTVTTNYNLNFEYKQDKFVLASSSDKITGIVNDCPVEIKKPVRLI